MSFLDSVPALAVLDVEFTPPAVAALDDAALLAAKRELAEVRRRLDATDAALSGEIAHRSRPELGYDGLAQRTGARTPEKLIQTITGISAKDARTQVRVGVMLTGPTTAEPADPVTASQAVPGFAPWLGAVAAAVAAGALSLDAADAIRAGLGQPTPTVTADALREAAAGLLRQARELTVEKLAVRAREARAAIDVAGVADREEALRARRFLHLTPQGDGMTRLSGLLDPESAATVVAAIDAATSPRRGGPRFIDPAARNDAADLTADPRTTEQIAADTLVELVRLGTLADTATFIGARRPAVQVLITATDLTTSTGIAHLEGHTEPVSAATARRHICETGTVPIVFDGPNVLNLGREHRLYTRRQRQALAARDGGCIWPDCDRPPSWCEAHHINHWHRDHGTTDIDHGVLLCRHHHLLVHNNGWTITRTPDHQRAPDHSAYHLIPPTTIDPTRTPKPTNPPSAAARRLTATHTP